MLRAELLYGRSMVPKELAKFLVLGAFLLNLKSHEAQPKGTTGQNEWNEQYYERRTGS